MNEPDRDLGCGIIDGDFAAPCFKTKEPDLGRPTPTPSEFDLGRYDELGTELCSGLGRGNIDFGPLEKPPKFKEPER